VRISDDDLKRALAELPEIELPAGFHDEVMAKIRKEAKPKQKKPLNYKVIGSFAAAAALVVIAVVTVMDFGQRVAESPQEAAAPMMIMDAMPESEPILTAPMSPPSDAGVIAGGNFAVGDEAYGSDLTLWSNAWRGFSFEDEEFDSDLEFQFGALPSRLTAADFEITVVVDDVEYALSVVERLGGHVLCLSYEDLESILAVLRTLGSVSTQWRETGAWEQNNIIIITLLQNSP